MDETLSYGQLLTLLKELISKKESATLYIKTEANRSAIIGTEKGDIVALSCGIKRGLAAIPDIRIINTASYRLVRGTIGYASSGLPSTADILAALESPAAPVPLPEVNGAGAGSMATSTFQAGPAVAQLQKLLRDFIGPIAPLVIEDALKVSGVLNSPADLQRLVDRLSGELPSRQEAERFRTQAGLMLKQRLG